MFRSFASEDRNITASIARLPGTLRTTTTTLGKVQRFARVLRPAARDLTPTFQALTRANKAVQPFAKEAAPILQNQIRPFVRDARPVVRTLKQPASDLATSTPQLTRSFTVLNHLFNLIGYNPNGREGPDKSMNTGPNPREEGYLFWIAWLLHNGNSLFSASDANGPYRPITVGGSCSTLTALASQSAPMQLEFLSALNDPASARNDRPERLRMQKQAPSVGRILVMVLFALSCFGLLLFLWLSFGGPVPLKPKTYQVRVAFPRPRSSASRPTCAWPACRSARSRARRSTPSSPTARSPR